MTTKKDRMYYITHDYIGMLTAQYTELAMNRIKWSGDMPKGMPKYIPENWLVKDGQCVGFNLPETDEFAILPIAYGSVKLDIYGNPTEWRAFPVGDSIQADIIRNIELNNENSVLIWNNGTRTGDLEYIRKIVEKMVALDKTLDINILMQRTPVFFKAGTKNNALTVENVFKDIAAGKQFIMQGNESGMLDNIDALNLGVQFIGDKLSDQYETYHNRILRYLGIDFLPVQKQERLITGEVSGNDNETVIRREIIMKYREKAVDDFKEILGRNIKVEFMDVVNDGPDNSPGMLRTSDDDGRDKDDEGGDFTSRTKD